jgi:hypothetical protein
VLSTIHLPSKDIFNLFTRLILLSDGYAIYNGPAKQAEHYFTSLGYIPTVLVQGAEVNPADFVIDVASHQLDTLNKQPRSAADLSQLQHVEQVPMIIGQILALNLQKDGESTSGGDGSHVRNSNTFDLRMTWILMKRYWLAIWNEGREIRTSIVSSSLLLDCSLCLSLSVSLSLLTSILVSLSLSVTLLTLPILSLPQDRHIITGLIHGLVFWQLKGDDSLARSSLLYFNAMFLVMNNEQCIPRIFEAKPLVSLVF